MEAKPEKKITYFIPDLSDFSDTGSGLHFPSTKHSPSK